LPRTSIKKKKKKTTTGTLRGYVAMLVVSSTHRGKGVGRELVSRAARAMAAAGAAEAALEAEATNAAALRLYEGLGFLRDKRLARYYLNGADAFRLKLRLPRKEEGEEEEMREAEVGGEGERKRVEEATEAVASLALAA
jgi:peptide alpha-N-acetyltransferase